jgi:hypothetical protein
MKLEIFGLKVRSSATEEKKAEKQHEKIYFWPVVSHRNKSNKDYIFF